MKNVCPHAYAPNTTKRDHNGLYNEKKREHTKERSWKLLGKNLLHTRNCDGDGTTAVCAHHDTQFEHGLKHLVTANLANKSRLRENVLDESARHGNQSHNAPGRRPRREVTRNKVRLSTKPRCGAQTLSCRFPVLWGWRPARRPWPHHTLVRLP